MNDGRLLRAVVLLVALSIIHVRAQQTKPSPPPVPTPRAACAKPFWDFGRVSNTNAVEHVFELANEGSTELQIQKVYAGCGCTATRVGSDRVDPGGKTQVTVRFDLTGRTGSQRKSIYVNTNDPVMPVLRFELAGEALGTTGANGAADMVTMDPWEGKARARPDRVDFGRVKSDAVTEGEIILRGASSNDAVKVAGIETGTANLAVRAEETGGVCRVVLRLSPGNDLGAGAASVVIHTSHPVLKTVTVPVTWKAEGDLNAIPEEITVAAKPGATNTAVRYVAIRSMSGKPVRLADVSCDGPGVKAEVSPLPGGKGVLVKVSCVVAAGMVDRIVTAWSEDGVRLRIRIRVVVPLGIGVTHQTPALSLRPAVPL